MPERQEQTVPLICLGEVIRFQRGDGYAQFVVWNLEPLELIWLETGDAWDVEDALIRGLNIQDITAMVERNRNLQAALKNR